MNQGFSFAAEAAATELRLIGTSGPIPVDLWAVEAPDRLVPGVDLVQRLVAAGSAIAGDDLLLIEHRAIAGLSSVEAAKLGLPPLADAVVHIAAGGLITRPDFRAELEWRQPNGQPILGAQRIGAWLRTGSELRRVPDALFALAEAVDFLNEAPGADTAGRLAALARLREALPAATRESLAEAIGLVAHMTIAVADCFSLDLKGEGASAQLVPILHRAQGDPEAALLPQDQQRMFGEQQFNGFAQVRPVYTLGGHWYVVLQPSLRRALAEVRRVNGASATTKRAFMANPRAFLREALGEDADGVVLEGVFRETSTYADRVVGLGLWAPRVVPWIKLGSTDWFGEGEPGSGRSVPSRPSEHGGGITIADQAISLNVEQSENLRRSLEEARASGDTVVPYRVGDEIVSVPATTQTLAALAALADARAEVNATGRVDRYRADTSRVLIIKENEGSVDFEEDVRPSRPSPRATPPSCLVTALKAHQADGLRWLQRGWINGLPGVLLADDMGLGKTLQGLAFLAWLREGMEAAEVPRAPVLIVAPTGLLQNWRAEHDLHFLAPGLGGCLEAHGRGLPRLKRVGDDGRPCLDVDALRCADWVLTTYETLRDYQADFGLVPFAAALFDEAQKIKTPAVRITDAAKAIAGKAEFRVALTGTPVENRLADLWCIADTVQPGLLGDLKSFSATYERNLDEGKLRTLKETLERSYGGRPQLMLRRLKEDHLPDVPAPVEHVSALLMPPPQRAAYEAAVSDARNFREPGAVLKALQRLRAISLHPFPEREWNDGDFIAASARLQGAIAALDQAANAGERALVFLRDRGLQARLAGLIQRRYRLRAPPMVINGSVDGTTRQARVDAFQVAPDGFDVMILSPQAGGVGLTLTRANHVVHLSRWWNPAVEDQCTGRVARIGQTRQVVVHVPMAVLEEGRASFDVNLHALLARKRKLMRETLIPAEATAAADRDELFRATVHQAA